jgi:hypothetical protein
MNFLEEIKELSRQTTLSNQERLRGLSDDALAEKMAVLRDSLLDAFGEAQRLYTSADFAARSNEAETGAYVWKETRTILSNLLNDWQNVPKMDDPQIDGIVEHYCKVLRNLLEKADQEFRSYSEKARAEEIPESFLAGLEDIRAGRVVDMEQALNEPPPKRA